MTAPNSKQDQWTYMKINKKLISNGIKSNEKWSWVWKTYGNMVKILIYTNEKKDKIGIKQILKILFLRIVDSTFSIPISPLKCYFIVFSPFPLFSFFYLPIRFLYSPIFPAHNFSCLYMIRLFINLNLTVSYYRFSIFKTILSKTFYFFII